MRIRTIDSLRSELYISLLMASSLSSSNTEIKHPLNLSSDSGNYRIIPNSILILQPTYNLKRLYVSAILKVEVNDYRFSLVSLYI